MKWLPWGVLLCTLVSIAPAHRNLEAHHRQESHEDARTLASLQAASWLSLGYKALAADYAWLKTIAHFGNQAYHAQNYPLLEPLLRRVVFLDPKFSTAYFFAGTALTIPGQEPTSAIALLRQGIKNRPDDWRLGFTLGFNLFHFAHRPAEAAVAMASVAQNPSAPKVARDLIGKLAAQAGEPELGLRLLEPILRNLPASSVKKNLLQQKKSLMLENHLRYLDQAIARYRAQEGQPPKHLDDLVKSNILRHIPQEPFGATYLIDKNGRAQTSDPGHRLKIYTKTGSMEQP